LDGPQSGEFLEESREPFQIFYRLIFTVFAGIPTTM